MRATALMLLAGFGVHGSVLAAESWQIHHDDSHLRFLATQQGGEFEGHFGEFAADIRFSPDDLDASGFDVVIDVTSVDTGSSQRDRELPTADWFFFEEYAEATYRADTVRATDDGFEAVGDLTIRDHTREVVLSFDWEADGDRASMSGEAVIDRTEFGVGQGEWEDPSAVGHEVRVLVDLDLSREP
ncbi:YceI family protein [Spiribacter sp. 2438]|uniref:YceI family protein n=1 Tax=Spiribacter sp. 2438 TaxID=2666185 RepID=UPI0012B0AD74|nr:YceI family protein [Spiribacter sp. 2438]QGM20901.1 YceI family protein [Spiribacter sp. 2438]